MRVPSFACDSQLNVFRTGLLLVCLAEQCYSSSQTGNTLCALLWA